MSGTSTAVALRCPRCGNLYDSDSNHRCGDADEEKISFGLGETLGEELVGAVLGERYAILERLSAGGMGVVYKAKHVLLDAEVAVKILLKPQDPDAQYRFLQEAQLASKIRHPNTVYISDFGLLPDGRSYIVMEFLRGPTLSEAISRGPISPLRACQIGLQIARGLQAVHDKGIIHRDLKPDNIFLIAQDGQQDFVKIVDFGIATHAAGPTINVRIDGLDPNSPEAQRALQQRHTLPGTVLGTPHYMSPEQALGDDVDPRADQYALGCILFEMLTGTVPFDDDDAAALMFKHAYRPPPRMRDRQAGLVLPEALEKIVTRTMAKKRDERFPAMRDLEQALVSEVEALGGRADPRRASSTNLAPVAPNSAPLITEVVPTQRPRKPLTFIVLGLALAVVLSGSLYGYLSYRRATQAAREHLDTSQLLALRGAAIEQLKRDLHSPDLELRQGALTALGTTYDRDLIPQIAALLDDKEASVRMRAAEVLGQLGQPSMLPRLFSLLETSTEQPVVAVAAAEALDELGDARGPLALRQALNGKNDAARLRAALYLCGHGDHEAQKVLNIAVQRGKVSEEGAVAILGRLAQAGDAAARENLITRLGSAPSRDLQLTLASLLGRIGESRGRDFLREQAHHPGPQQLRAAALLAALDEPVDAEQFRAVLGNRDAVASARLLALTGLSYVGAVTDLLHLHPILDDVAEPRVRQGAAVAMVRISDSDPTLAAAQTLGWAQEAATDPNWLLRDQAVAALGDLKSRDGATALARLLKRHDSDPVMRQKVAQALGRRREPEALGALRDGLSDSDSGVQIAARAALLASGDETQRPLLQRALFNGDEAQRRQVIDNVGRDRILLGAALDDKSPTLRRLAARKLAAIGDKRAVPVLQQASSDTSNSAEALTAYAALRRLGEPATPPQSAAALAALGGSSDPEVRGAALEAATAQGPEAARPALERAARDPDRKVRLKVVELIGNVAPGAEATPILPAALSLPVLKRLSHDPDVAVRGRASALLTRLQPVAPTAPVESHKPGPPAPPTSKGQTAPVGKAPGEVLDAGTARTAVETTAAAVPDAAVAEPPAPPTPPAVPAVEADNAGSLGGNHNHGGIATPDKMSHEELESMLRAGSEPFKRKDFRKAQKALERLSSLCQRESAKVCAPISYELSYYLGRSYEAQGQSAEAMNEFQRLEGQRGGNAIERAYLGDAVQRLSKKLGRVQVQRLRKGHCETTIMWVTPGEQEIRISATEKRAVRVSANQKTSVGACK